MNLTNQQKVNIAAVLGLIIALLSTVLQFINDQPVTEVATPLSANVPCYFDQGGKQFNVDSGCTLRVKSGGSVTLDSGSLASVIDLILSGRLTAANATITGTVAAAGVSSTGNVTVTGDVTATGGITSVAGFVGPLAATSLSASGNADLNGGADITGTFTVSGFTQYPFAFFGSESAVNGDLVAHGLGATPTYPWCMVYDAAWVTVTARISATNATSVTLAIFDATGEPWTESGVPVRCGAVHVP